MDGKNFFDSSKVQWNNTTRDTRFVDSTRLEAVIPGTDVAAAGVATVTVSTPGPGGGESNKKTFGFAGTLFFPRLVSTDGTQAEPDDSEYTGIAVANLGGEEAALTFTAFDKSGSLISGTGITNPATVSIKPGQQLPVVDFQLFGSTLPSLKPVGWFRMDSTHLGCRRILPHVQPDSSRYSMALTFLREAQRHLSSRK